VLSARYAGEPKSDARNNAKLIAELAGRRSRAHISTASSCSCATPTTRSPIIADGEWHGEILSSTPRGDGGFGYDPLSRPRLEQTAAELDAAELKNRRSHRGLALPACRAPARGADEPRAEGPAHPGRVIPLIPARRAANGQRQFNSAHPPPLALYVHFPWCVQKCPYCDFNSCPATEWRRGVGIPEADYLAALIADLEAALPTGLGPAVTVASSSAAAPPACSPATASIGC
jgi:hypothetical protein